MLYLKNKKRYTIHQKYAKDRIEVGRWKRMLNEHLWKRQKLCKKEKRKPIGKEFPERRRGKRKY